VQGSQSNARPLRLQSEQLPTESQVFEDEVLAGAKRADDPPEEIPERHNHPRILSELSEFSFALSHSFCRCTTFWRDTGESPLEISYGLTSRAPQQAGPQHVLQVNRGHGVIESCHYMIDGNYEEDRGRIRTGHGPENITRLRRFAIGVIKSKGRGSMAQKMRRLTRNVRLVFDYLRMSKNSCTCRSN
jgi:hypothetical protein